MGRWEIDHGKRLPMESLSKETGISPQVLSKLADPAVDYATSSRHLEALCRFFGVTMDGLVVFVTPPKQETAESAVPPDKEDESAPR